MKGRISIERLRISSFGQFRAFDCALQPGLNVFYGPNEAGKSTLWWFLRQVLFGFERSRGAAERYETGTPDYGGEVTLSTPEGRLSVKRGCGKRLEGEVRLRSASGDSLLPSRLQDALGGISRELYFELYAFDLDKLASLHALASQSGVAEALSVAGMAGAHRLPSALELLERGAQELFSPSANARKSKLNALLRELQEAQAQLQCLGDVPAEYVRAQEDLEAVERTLVEWVKGCEEVTPKLDAMRRLQEALGPLAELRTLEAQTALLSEYASFPEGATLRLEAIESQKSGLEEEGAQLFAKRAQLEATLEQVRAMRSLGGHASSIRSVVQTFQARAEVFAGLPARRASLSLRMRQRLDELRGLGVALDAERLCVADFGEAARGELEDLRDEVLSSERALAESEELFRAQSAFLRALAEKRREWEIRIAQLPQTSLPALRERYRALSQLELAMSEVERLRRLRRAPSQARGASKNREGFTARLALILSGVGLALGVAVSFVVPPGQGNWVLLMTFLVLGLLWMRQRKGARTSTLWESQCQAAQEVFERIANQAKVSSTTTPEALVQLLEEVSEEVRRGEERVRLIDELAGLEREHRKSEEGQRQAQEALDFRKGESERARQALHDWLSEREFPTGLPAHRAVERWMAAKALRQQFLDLFEEKERLSVDARAQEALAEEVTGWAERLGLGVLAPEAAAAALKQAVELEEERRGRLSRLEEQRILLASSQQQLQHKMDRLNLELSELLSRAEAAFPEALRARSKEAERYRELLLECSVLTGKVEAACHLSPAEAWRHIVEVGGPEGLGQRLHALEAERDRLVKLRNEKAEERGRLMQTLEGLETGEAACSLRFQEEAKRTEALVLARAYLEQRLAWALLEKARKRFEEEKQPRLLQVASTFFHQLTLGRYSRVFAEPSTGTLLVRDGGGDWKTEALSRGTREQLYLALRLAAMNEFAESRPALPVLVDDVLVNFDLSRAQAAVETLATFASTHQVIAFTCHPWLRALFERAGAQLIALEDVSEKRAHVA